MPRGRNITSLTGFISRLEKVERYENCSPVYRGHERQVKEIQPSIFRDNSYEYENSIIREVISLHPDEFNNDMSTLDQLVRIQHYGFPTRLLDISWNPLVALYFAVSKEQNEENAEVIIFHVHNTAYKYYDSDTVSCCANLANLSSEEKKNVNKIVYDNPDYNNINNSTDGDKLTQFIRKEKPYFRSRMLHSTFQELYLVKPKMNNRRILAQSGGFIIFGLNDDISGSDNVCVEKIGIDGASKNKIKRELRTVGIHQRSLFPEIDKASDYILSEIWG